MATQPAAFKDLMGDGSVIQVTWVLTGTDDGSPVQFSQFAGRSMQIGTTGDAFAVGTVIIEGNNDGSTTWTNLRAPDSTALSFAAAGLKGVLERVGYIRPRASVAVTSVTCILLMHRSQPLRT